MVGKRKADDDLNHWKTEGQKFLGLTASIGDHVKRITQAIIIDVAKREDPLAQDGSEDMYYRAVDASDSLIRAIKVRDADVDVDPSVPKYTRIERTALEKRVHLYGGNTHGRESLKNGYFDGADVKIWREVEGEWFEGIGANLVRHGQTEHTFTYTCSVLCRNGIQVHNFPLCESSWELVVDEASKPAGTDGSDEDSRAKRRRKRVDVPNALGIFEGNLGSHGGRRNQVAIGRPRVAEGQPGQGRKGRHSMPSQPASAASDDKAEHPPGSRRGRRRVSAADTPAPRGRSAARGRKAAAAASKRGRKGTQQAVDAAEPGHEGEGDDDDMVIEDEDDNASSQQTPASAPGEDGSGSHQSGAAQPISGSPQQLPDADPRSDDEVEAAGVPADQPAPRGGVKARARKRGGAAGRGGRRPGARKRAPAGHLAEKPAAADDSRGLGGQKRRRETQSPGAPAPDPNAPNAEPGEAAATQDMTLRPQKAHKRGRSHATASGSGEQPDPRPDVPGASVRKPMMARRLENGARPRRKPDAPSQESPRADGGQPETGLSHSIGGDSGAGAGRGRRGVSADPSADRQHSDDAAAAGAGISTAVEHASLPSASGVRGVSEGGRSHGGTGAGSAAGKAGPMQAQGSQEGSRGLGRDSRGQGSASKDAHAAAASHGSRGRSYGKGVPRSEATQSEGTKDSTGVGSRRAPGLPAPVVNAPAQGSMGIFPSRPVSQADTVGTADVMGPGHSEVAWAFEPAGAHDVRQAGSAHAGSEHVDGLSAGGAGPMDTGDATDGERGVSEPPGVEGGNGADVEKRGRGVRQAAWREAKKIATEADEAELAAEGVAAEPPASEGKRRGKQSGVSPGMLPAGVNQAAQDPSAIAPPHPEAAPAPVGVPSAAGMHAQDHSNSDAMPGLSPEVFEENLADAGNLTDAGAHAEADTAGAIADVLDECDPDGLPVADFGLDAAENDDPHAWPGEISDVAALREGQAADELANGSRGDQQVAGAETAEGEDLTEVAESEEEMLPRKRQKRPTKGKVMPQPPVALTSPPHGSPGEASSEGGRFAARRPAPSHAALSRQRKSSAFATNGVGKPASGPPSLGRRGARGLTQVEVARAAAPPQVQPQPAKPAAQPRCQASGMRLGPQSLVAPSATLKTNRFVRTRPTGGVPGSGSAASGEGRSGAGGTGAAQRSPDSPPSLLRPTPGSTANERPGMDDGGDQLDGMDMIQEESGGPDDEIEPGTRAAQVAGVLADAAVSAVAAIADAAEAVVHPTEPVLEEPAQDLAEDAARADPKPLALQQIASTAVACAEEAVQAAVEDHMHASRDVPAQVGHEAAVAAAGGAAAEDTDGADTGILGEPLVTATAAPHATAAHRSDTAVGAVLVPVLTQQKTVQSALPAADQLQQDQGASMHPYDKAAREAPATGAAESERPHTGGADAQPPAHRAGASSPDSRGASAARPASAPQPQKPAMGSSWGGIGKVLSWVGSLGRGNSATANAAAAAAPDAERADDTRARSSAPTAPVSSAGAERSGGPAAEQPAAAGGNAGTRPDALPVSGGGGAATEAGPPGGDIAMQGSETEDDAPLPEDTASHGRGEGHAKDTPAAEAADDEQGGANAPAPPDSEMQDAPLEQAASRKTLPPLAAKAPAQQSAELLLRSPPPSPDADNMQAGKQLLPDDAIADDGIVGVTSEEPPLAETLTQPADEEVDDGAALTPIRGLPCSPRAQGTGNGDAAAPAVFAQGRAGGDGLVGGGGGGGAVLPAATSLDMLRARNDGDMRPGARAAAAGPVEAAAPAAAAAAGPSAAAVGDTAGGAAGPSSGAALPAIRAKRTARAMPPPVTEPPPPATVAPRGSRKQKLKVVRGSKKGDAVAAGPSGSAAPSSKGAPGSSAHFICTEGGGPCSGMERLAPLSDPRKLIPDDQTMGQRIGLGTTPAGTALVWEVDIDNVDDFSSSLQVASGERGAQLLMRRTVADPGAQEAAEEPKEPYRGNNGAEVPCGPAPTREDILRAEHVAFTMLAPEGMKLETIASGGVRAEATPAPGIARLTFRLRDGSSVPPTT